MENHELEWMLIDLEEKYGGFTGRIAVDARDISPMDTRKNAGFERGGDRMSIDHHYYAPIYARFLSAGMITRPRTVVEVGILTGVGLAIWADIFPAGSRIIGLDVAPTYFYNNYDNLKDRGAFLINTIEAHKFDQYANNGYLVQSILRGDRIDMVIDDGCHQTGAILNTLRCLRPHLADDFLYFVEDNATVSESLAGEFPDLDVAPFREGTRYKDSVLTLVRPKR